MLRPYTLALSQMFSHLVQPNSGNKYFIIDITIQCLIAGRALQCERVGGVGGGGYFAIA